MRIPKSISRLIDSFQRLPGIGPKTAQRLTYQLLHFPQEELENFANALVSLKKETKLCRICKNVSENEICSVCSDSARNKYQILVVSSILDVYALEKTDYKGTYHVLHGVIDPLNNIGPDEIFLKELTERIHELLIDSKNIGEESDREPEIILGTSSSLEGESTAMYISKIIKEDPKVNGLVVITRIARGLPVGGDIEYADDVTLSKAIEGRSSYN